MPIAHPPSPHPRLKRAKHANFTKKMQNNPYMLAYMGFFVRNIL